MPPLCHPIKHAVRHLLGNEVIVVVAAKGAQTTHKSCFNPNSCQWLLGNKILLVQNHTHSYMWVICWLNDVHYSIYGALGVQESHKMMENEKNHTNQKI